MGDRMNREKKGHFQLGGTGLYIALFLGLTAAVVTGYYTLIPQSAKEKDESRTVMERQPVVIEPVIPKVPEIRIEPQEEPKAEPQKPVSFIAPVEESEPEPPVAPHIVVAPLEGEAIAAFSMDELVYSETLDDWRTHDGVDLAAEEGMQVIAACSGTVHSVLQDDLMGMTVMIAHDGGYMTTYANLQSQTNVAAGEYVSAGQVIGTVGKTSMAESAMAPHLHFSVTQNGETIDPIAFLEQS